MLAKVSFILLLSVVACQKGPKLICPGLEFEDSRFSLTNSEKILLCGDPKDPSWRDIPRPQKIFSVKNFLLDRGYYSPKIEEDPEKVKVYLGPRSRLKILNIQGWPSELKPYPKRRFIKRLLKPSTLTDLQSDVLKELKAHGYACAELEIEAFAEDSRVEVKVKSGASQLFGKVERDEVAQLNPSLFDRFEAFHKDQKYDFRLLELTESRVRASGLVQDIALLPVCPDSQRDFYISQRTFAGRPRFVSVGAGFDTEEYLITKARLAFYRLGSEGSSLQTKISASIKIQKIDNLGLVDFLPAAQRHGLYFGLHGKREDEKRYELIAAAARFGYRKDFDNKISKVELKTGPLYEQSWIYRGPGLKNTHALALEASVEWLSHGFEYYAANPKSGLRLEVSAQGTSAALKSSFSALKTEAHIEGLVSVWEDHQAEIIGALRSFYATTFQLSGKKEGEKIPPDYRFFLGGARDLRGFPRKEIPGTNAGAFTAAYVGTEFRLIRVFKIEPLVFLDWGTYGLDSLNLIPQYFLSPGFGFRYKSPFGTLRGTAAQGYTKREAGSKSRFQIFLSFGDEF